MVQESSHISPPPTTPGPRNSLFPNYPHAPAHPQPWHQRHLMSMSPAVQHGEGGSVGVGSSTGSRSLNPAVPGLSSWEAQPIQPALSNSDYLDPSVVQRQVLRPAPSSAKKRRRSELDLLDAVQHTQAGFLNQLALENEPTPDEYTYSSSNSLPANSTAQHHAAVPVDMVPRPSSLHRESVGSLQSEASFQPSSSSSLQDELDGGAMLSPGLTSVSVLSHSAGHIYPQQDSSSAAPEAPRKRRRDGQRKQTEVPIDPIATDRLRKQRKKDDQLLDLLFSRYVPSSAAQGRVAKKDRLPLSAFRSLYLSC